MAYPYRFLAALSIFVLAGCGTSAVTAFPPTGASPVIEITPVSVTEMVSGGTVTIGTAVPVIVSPLPPDFTPPPTSIPPTPTSIPTLPGGFGPTELKYRLLDQFPNFFFCDPDYYPVARDDELVLARQRFPELQANTEEFQAILSHAGLGTLTQFNDEQMLLVYREHKKLAALSFELTSAGYHFQIQIAEAEGQGELVSGVIDGEGTVTIQQTEPSFATCPICLAAGTLIDTPAGPIPVQNLRPGMLVWTTDASGLRIAQPVIRIGETIVPAAHRVVHLVLDDGRELWVSPAHPTAEGLAVGQLKVGDVFAGGIVLSAERVSYAGLATYDLLPAGESGFYWANGILLASTLSR